MMTRHIKERHMRLISAMLGSLLALAGCSTGEVMKTPNNETYTVSSGYMLLAGGWERSSFEAREKASNFCKATGLQMEVADEKRDGTPGFTALSTYLHFRCTEKGASTSSATPKSNNMTVMSFDQAKDKCLNLGFKTGTESFGQCILKLVN